MILGPTARPFVVLGGEFARSVRRRGERVMAFHDISTRVKAGESKVSRMDEAIQWSQSLLSFDAGASSTSQNSPVVCPKPTVRVRGWNQAEKVGGGGTVGGLIARNGEGGLPEGALRGNADPHAHAALMSNL